MATHKRKVSSKARATRVRTCDPDDSSPRSNGTLKNGFSDEVMARPRYQEKPDDSAKQPSSGPDRSGLQSHKRVSRNGTFVPRWAELITPDYAERCALGKIDYWLGLDDRDHVRAKGRFLHVDDNGVEWYVVTARRFSHEIVARDRYHAWRIIDRLCKKGFVIKERHTQRDGWTALRLRLNWKVIEASYAAAAHDEDDM